MGRGENGKLLFSGTIVSVCKMKRDLEVHNNINVLHSDYWSVHLKMVEMVNFIVYVFYHNFENK